MLLSGALSDPGLKKKHPLLKVFLSVVRIQLLFSYFVPDLGLNRTP